MNLIGLNGTVNLNMRELPDGRVCIHWLVLDENGPIRTHRQMMVGRSASIVDKLRRWKIVCRPEQNSVNPQRRGDQTLMCMHSDDIRAVTCPDCRATKEALALLDSYNETDVSQVVNALGKMAAKSA